MKPIEQLNTIKSVIAAQTVISNGLITNPMFNVSIDEKTGDVIGRRGTILSANDEFYTVRVDTIQGPLTLSFHRIVSLMLGIDLPKGYRISKINESGKYTRSNLQVTFTTRGRNSDGEVIVDRKVKPKLHSEVTRVDLRDNQTSNTIELNGYTLLEFKTEVGYYTVDGERFNDKEQATYHQDQIQIAQEACTKIIENKGGYELAKSVFKTIVGVDQSTNYKDFKSLLIAENTIEHVDTNNRYQFMTDSRFGDLDAEITENASLSISQVKEIIMQVSMMNVAKSSIFDVLTK